jgi:DNA-binding transcriptional ArsR family regulator
LTIISIVLMIAAMLIAVVDWLRSQGFRCEVSTELSLDNGTHLDALLVVHLDDRRHRFAVERRRRAPYPGELGALEERRVRIERHAQPLLSAPYISATLGRELTARGWSWADDAGNLDLRDEGLRVVRDSGASPPRPSTPSRIPRRGAGLAIVRFLIRHVGPWGPSHLAQVAGVSQPRASQVLQQLADGGLVERRNRGEWEARFEELFDAFLEGYAGPSGSRQWCYTLDDLATAASRLSDAVEGGRVAISADVGADVLAAHRRPTHLVAYVTAPVDDRGPDLVAAEGPEDANMTLIVPEDRTVFSTVHEVVAPVPGGELLLADPTQVVWDLERLGGADRLEASEEVRGWIRRNR